MLCLCRWWAVPKAQWNRPHTQSPDEDPQDDHCDCCLLCNLLDSLLPPWDLVLVPTSHHPAHTWVHTPHSVCLRQPEHLLRPCHLWLLHRIFPGRPCWCGGMLPRPPSQRLTSLCGSSVRSKSWSCWGDGVWHEFKPAQWESKLNRSNLALESEAQFQYTQCQPYDIQGIPHEYILDFKQLLFLPFTIADLKGKASLLSTSFNILYVYGSSSSENDCPYQSPTMCCKSHVCQYFVNYCIPVLFVVLTAVSVHASSKGWAPHAHVQFPTSITVWVFCFLH